MTFRTISKIAAAVRCLNAGQSVSQVAASAKVRKNTVYRWLRAGGFKRINGRYHSI